MNTDKVLKRKPVFAMKQDVTYWFNPFTGEYLDYDNTIGHIQEPEVIADMLNWLSSHSQANKLLVYLVAGTLLDERPEVEFFDTHGTEWQRTMFSWEKLDATYCQGERCIRVIGTGEYWGYSEDENLTDLKQAKATLETLIEQSFNDVCTNGRVPGFHFDLRYTPSATGRELVAGSLISGYAYPVLPEAITEWIVSHYGQSRIETLAPATPIVDDGSYILDARWMYAACIDGLPLGDPLHDTENKRSLKVSNTGYIYPAIPGFYRIETKVPADWHHIGLVKDSLLSEEIGHSVYPSDPGYQFEASVTADELAMLTQYKWSYRIVERLLFPDTEKYKQPLERWNTRLVALREKAEKNQYATLLKNGIRAIHLHTIGSFWRGYDYVYHETPFDDLPLPDDVVIAPYSDFEDYDRELYCWDERVPLSPARRQFYHPEWSAIIWGKARRRLTEFALKLPYESIIYLNTDGIWCTHIPEWVSKIDTGKPGSFRVKDHIPGPFMWPDTSSSMRASVLEYNERKRVNHG